MLVFVHWGMCHLCWALTGDMTPKNCSREHICYAHSINPHATPKTAKPAYFRRNSEPIQFDLPI